ncbi:MAG: TaqI-like C-terminal specificity domain-containing protein [Patescibacteria group bacterium]|nr:TaqI-like C-terminal specificity domain-containing protein [Patescibacteria group bacterium]
MNTLEIKNKFDQLLKQLSTERSFDIAEKITTELVGLLNIKTTDRFLVNIPRVDAELTRFQLAPGFARQAAAYELPHEDDKPFDLKLFWVKKTSKTNLSWIIGLTPNFEDALSNDYKNIGIDFVVPETCDSVIVLLSNKFKIRALELKDHITPTQLEIFAQWAKLSEIEIADQTELKNNLHAKLWESFNFEPINRKFYLELVEHFSILVHHLEKDFERKQSVMFTTRLIGRLLFIWFLKKKNLVNNNVNYFSVPDPEKQSEYYKNQLEKLFFEVLNREELERDNGDKLTPYLNGGLFDKNTTDFYNDPKLTFPNGYFNQLFTTLNKYNFTVDESSPEFQHVAIDPEMLGRIFESLLAEQIDENTGNSKKKATGAFYTPREIVSYMCEQSLIEYLKTKVPEAPDRDRRIEELVRMPEAIFRDQDQNKRRDWKPYREAIIKALEGSKTESPLTVLDPAVGSGAFPMGMLHLLVKVYSRLDPKFEKDISGLKRDILSRSLYGVDIEQTAIEITRLRAWLSIIVDIPEGEKVEPLPNLEFKFICANTLIPLDETEQATFFTDHNLKDKLITIRDEYFKTSSKAKKEKLQKDYLKLTQNTSLFDNKKTQQLKSYKPFDISSSSEFYDPELMHGVEAFDIVIGNPPYVGFGVRNSEKISQFYKKEIIKLYPNSAEYKINLYPLFMERAIILCQRRGIQSFIVPDSFLLGKYFSKIRKYVLDTVQISKILLFSELVFEAVVGYSVVYVFKKTTDKKNNIDVIKVNNPDLTNLKPFSYSQDTFEKTKLNRFRLYFNNNEKILIERIEEQKRLIGELIEFKSGLISKIGQKEIISSEKKSEEWYKGVISGGEINKYCISWGGNYIRYKKDLIKSGFGNVSYFENKIFVRQTGDKLISAFDIVGYLCLNNVHVGNIVNKIYTPETITSIINSKLINKYYEVISLEKGRVMAQIDIDVLDSIPVPNVTKDEEEIIKKLVDDVIVLKKQNKDADTRNLEAQIDQLVYKFYDLTPEEIEIVENSSK